MNWQQEWQSITETPDYQQSNDAVREGMRNDYFARRIAPNFDYYDQTEAKQIFDEYTAPAGNPDGSFLTDAWYLAKSGFQGAVGDLARGATLGHDNPVAEYMRTSAEENMMQVTPSMLEAIEATGIDYEPGQGLSGISIKEDSSVKGLIGQTIQGIGSLPVSIGAGGAYGKAFGVAGRAIGGKVAGMGASHYAANIAKGNLDKAVQILSRRDVQNRVANSVGFGTMGGQMMVGGVASQAYDEISHMPIEELRKLQPYQDKLQEAQQLYPDNPAMAEAHARETLAKDTSLANRWQSGALGFVTSVMTGPIEQRILMGRGAATRRGNIGRGMLTEAVEEFSESGGQQLLSNKAQIDVAKREMDLMDGVLSQGMTGAVSGSLVGGALGGVGRPNRPVSKELLGHQLESAHKDIHDLQERLKDDKLDKSKKDELEMQLGAKVEEAFSIKQAYDKAPTEEQLSRQTKNEPEPDSDTGINTPLMRPDTRDWVPADIDDRISEATKDYRNIQSTYRRVMGAQGLELDSGHFEKQLKDKKELLDSYQMLRQNRHNAQFFESKEVFDDWIKRKLKGGLEAQLADNELLIRRKGRVMQDGMINIHDQVHAWELTEQEEKERHIAEQERKWEQLQQEMEQQKQAAQEMRGRRSLQERAAEKAPTSRALSVYRGMKEQEAKQAEQAERERREKQQAHDQRIAELEKLTSLKGAGDVRNVLSHIRNGDNYNLRYGDKQLNIKNGQVDPGQLQDFVNYSKEHVPRQDKQQRVAGARERGVMPGEQSGKAFESAMKNRMQELSQILPDNDIDAQKMGYVLNAMGNKQANITVSFGDGQSLEITNGEVNPRTLNEFVRDMESQADRYQRRAHGERKEQRQGLREKLEKGTGRTGGKAVKQSRLRSSAFKKLNALPEIIKDNPQYKSAVDAISNNKDNNIHFGKENLAIRKGKFEVGQLNKFIDHLKSEAEHLEAKASRKAKQKADAERKAREASETKSQFVKRVIDHWVKKTGDKQFAATRATHIHTDPVTGEKTLVQYGGEPIEAGHVMYYDNQGLEFGGRPDEFTPIPGREFMYEDLLPKKQQTKAEPEPEPEPLVTLTPEKIKAHTEKLERREPYPESEATHVWRPKGGKPQLLKPYDDKGTYIRPDGSKPWLGDQKNRIKSLKEIEADKERQRKAQEAEERKQALEKARELQDLARQEAARKVRFENAFAGQHYINRFMGDHGIGFDPEKSGLKVVEKKGDFHFVDANGDRLDAAQLTEYVDAIKEDGFLKYQPPYKPEPAKVAKITQKNLQDKDLIGNGRGNPWNRKHNAEDQLRKKGLADTHYVSGDKLFFIKRKPDLSGIQWGYQSYETAHGIIETIMVPESPVTGEQQTQIREFTGERFTQYRDPKSPIIEGMANPKKGDMVVKLRRGNRDSFLKTLQDTKPPEAEKPAVKTEAEKPSAKPAEPSAPTEVARGITAQPGELNGVHYNRRADVRQVPPTPEGLAEFAHSLRNGDLLVDKFGNERGVVAAVRRHYTKLVTRNPDTGNTTFEEYSLTDSLPKGKEYKQQFTSAYDRLKHGKPKAPPSDDGLGVPDVAKIKKLNPEAAKKIAAEVAEQTESKPEKEAVNEGTGNHTTGDAGSEPGKSKSAGKAGKAGTNALAVPGTDQSGRSAGSRGGKAGSAKAGQGSRAGSAKNEPVDATGRPAGEGDRAGPDHRGSTVPVRQENYRITDDSLAVDRSWKQKAEDNLKAIEIIQQLEREDRAARPDEQAILARYVGWGATDLANNMFPMAGKELSPEWQAMADRLKKLLPKDQYRTAASTVNYAHFTGQDIIRQMFSAAEQFGVKSGLAFEGGTGVGHFAGLIPSNMNLQYTGVEMDSMSARIAQALYPSHGIIEGDFTRVGFPDNHFDLTFGNPPYANSVVKSDPKYAGKKFQLHDYFIAKQIDSLKPGGVGVFITSSRTMDKKGSDWRNYVDSKAHFLGAVRLPNTAFQQNAGAEVVTDLLFFQKRGEGTKDTGHQWQDLQPHPDFKSGEFDEQGVELPLMTNPYFLQNPDMVIGTPAMTSGRFGQTYTVKPGIERNKGESAESYFDRLNKWMGESINKALDKLPKDIVPHNPTPAEMDAAAAKYDFNPKDKEDSFYIREDGSIGQVIDGYGQSAPIRTKQPDGKYTSGLNKKQQQYIRSYIPLRDAVMKVYQHQLSSDAQWQKAVNEMKAQYDAFVKKNGPINQGKVTTITPKDPNRKPYTMVREPILSTIVMDPEAFRIAAIEDYDVDTNTAKPTRIFREKMLGVQAEPKIESAVDAVGATLNELGYLDIDKVAEKYGMPAADVVSELGDQVFMDPATGKQTLRDNYLSGNVKAKLAHAQEMAKTDPAYERNVRALKEVIPDDLPVSAIPTSLGAMWIPESTIAKFADKVLGIKVQGVHKFRRKEMSDWTVKSSGFGISDFDTRRKKAHEILEATLNQRTIMVYDTNPDKTRTLNDKETAAANQQQQKMKDAFAKFAREDGDTADTLAQIYNRDFNTTVPTKHDGGHLTFPGLSSKYKLRPHQANVVWRIVQHGNTYMAHAVGAGKTLASIVAGMELKRLGVANKPTYVVLKSTLKQFASEYLDAYPNARILVADENQLDQKNRRRFMAKVANENWDAVIMTHESFNSIPMSDDYIQQYMERQIDDLETTLTEVGEDDGLTRKQLENQKSNLAQKLQKHIDDSLARRKDKGIGFEESGIDYLFVDEAHHHKKIGFPTVQGNLKGVDSQSSGKATDLFMKTQYLEQQRPGKHTVLMSGTPVSNTMGELFNIQRYLQPQVLEANQISSFDSWTATFAETATNIEMQPDGSFKPVTRMTRFVGVPGLMRDVKQIMDYVGMEEMREKGLVKLPKLHKQVIAVEKSPELGEFQVKLGDRIKKYESLPGREKTAKGTDNILTIMGDGKKAAIDMRLVNETQTGESKLDRTINDVYQGWKDSRDTVYYDKDGNPEPVKGSIQLVFSDLYRAYDPKDRKKVTFDAFAYAREQLVKKGIPASEIAFISEYGDSIKKKRLFKNANDGKVTVIFGGSDNLGTGVNVQKRLIRNFNLDINYVPAKMDQRTGRVERQGNQNGEVYSALYVTKGTTDATTLQMNENKARMADQVLRGDFTVHSMEDVSSTGDELAQAKAIASGNPLLLEQAGVNTEYRRLSALRDAHFDKLARIRNELAYERQAQERLETELPGAQEVASHYVSTRGDKFKVEVNGKTYDKRADAGKQLLFQLESAYSSKASKPRQVGKLGNYKMFVQYDPSNMTAMLSFEQLVNGRPIVDYRSGEQVSEQGLMTKAENDAAKLANRPEEIKQGLEHRQEAIDRYEKALGQPFEYQQQLDETKARLDEINESLQEGEQASDSAQDQEAPTRYRLSDKPAKRNYETRAIARKLEKTIGDIATVVHHESDLPQRLQKQIQSDGVSGRVKGVYDSVTGQVYVVASRAESIQDAVTTTIHEEVGHKGLRSLLDDSLDSVLDQVYRSLPASDIRQLRETYRSQLAGKTKPEQRRLIAEERLAHLAETQPNNNLLQRAIARIRQWLRKRFPGLKFSDNDLRQLVMEARKKAGEDRQGKRPGQPEATLRYQMDKDAVADNIRKGIKAAKQVLKSHKDVVSAMHRPDIGDIDLIWGTEGSWPPKKKAQVRKGQKGIAHIIEARIRKNKLTEAEAKEVLFNIIETVAKGDIFSRKTSIEKGKKNDRVVIRMGNYKATLINEDADNKNHYLLTGFELVEGSASGETRQAQDRPGSTHNRPTRRRPEVGAEAESTINDSTVKNQGTNGKLRYKLSDPAAMNKLNSMDKEQAKKLVKLNTGSMKEWVRANGLGFLGGRQIAEIYHKLFDKIGGKNLLDQVNNMTQALSNLRSQWAHRGGQIDNDWAKLTRDKHAYNTLSDLMHESTVAGVDPRWTEYKAKYGEISDLQKELDKATTDKQKNELQRQIDEETQRRKDYKHLKEKHRLLGKSNPQATKIYEQVSQYYNDQHEATREALYNRIKGMELDPESRGKLRSEIDAMFHRAVADGPYFPLMRFGDFAVVGKTRDGEYYREHFESQKDMQLGMEELQREGFTIDDYGKNLEMDPAKMGGVSEFSGRIYKALETKKMKDIDPKAKQAFMDEVHQISLAMMPELSAAKRGMHRRKVPGYDTNARRAFNSVALHGANRLGRIEYGWRIDADITRMEKMTTVGYEGETSLSPDERIIAHSVAKEMRKRHELNMNPNGHPIAAAIANFTFFQYLGASAGAGFVNMTQNVLVGLPVLSGRYGMRRSARFMGAAANDFRKFGRQKMEGHEDYLNKPWWSLENIKPNKNITADEIQLIRDLVEDGTIEITQAHSMAQQAGSDIQPEFQHRREWLDKLMKGSGAFFHNAEVFNRQVMALTAYRLYKADHKGKFDANAAKDYVRKAVFDAHFDYSSFNRARHMKGNWAKVFLIFKQHSQNMTYHLAKNFHDGFVDRSDPEQSAAARKVLMTTLGLHALFAGTLGLPGMSVLLAAVGAAFGDEDDPKDYKVEMRNYFSDIFGPQLGHALSKGLFDGYLNLGLHTRTRLSDLWFGDPGYDMSARQEAQYYLTHAMGGPFIAYLINGYVGLTEMAQGDSMKGLQRIMPKFVRDGLRTIEYSRHGIVDKSGKVIVEDITAPEMAMQTFGIAPARFGEAWDARGAISQYDTRLSKRRNDLLRQLDRAVRNEDQRLYDRTVENIQRFNNTHRHREDTKGYIIPDKTIRRSLKAAQKRREESVLGINLSSTKQGMLEHARGFQAH